MLRLLGLTVAIAAMTLLLWQTAAADPFLPRAVSGLLLAAVGVLVGLRVGAYSAAAYTRDLQRLNKVLADQNQELQDANAEVLQRLHSSIEARSDSA